MIELFVTQEEYESIKGSHYIRHEIFSRHGIGDNHIYNNNDKKIRVCTLDGDVIVYEQDQVMIDINRDNHWNFLGVTVYAPKVWDSTENRIVDLVGSIEYLISHYEHNTKDVKDIQELKKKLRSCTKDVVGKIKKVLDEDIKYITMLEEENKNLRKKLLDKQ